MRSWLGGLGDECVRLASTYPDASLYVACRANPLLLCLVCGLGLERLLPLYPRSRNGLNIVAEKRTKNAKKHEKYKGGTLGNFVFLIVFWSRLSEKRKKSPKSWAKVGRKNLGSDPVIGHFHIK